MSPATRTFADKPQLAAALSQMVAQSLTAAVNTRGKASLAVSGGSTPALFFRTLGARDDVPWENVTITLVDERWVDDTSDRSNARLVKTDLWHGPAASAKFVPLYAGGAEPDRDGLAATATAFVAVPTPLDVVILGMGNDGHTASFFPGGDHLAEALTGEGPVVAMHAPGAGEARVTLTLPVLLRARTLILHIEGEEKALTLRKAEAEGPIEAMPIRAVLRQTQTPLTVFWCP